MKKPPAFQFYARDWLTDDKRSEMSIAQRGVHADLMAYQWVNGSVPGDIQSLARIVGIGVEEMQEIFAGPLAACYPVNGDGRRRNPRLERQRAELELYRKRRSHAGKLGAQVRYGQRLSSTRKVLPVANGQQKDSSASASASGEGTTTTLTTLVELPLNGSTPLARVEAWIETAAQRAKTSDERMNASVGVVFAYWARVMNHRRVVLDRKRFSRIAARLRENGRDASELLYAIDGAATDDFLMGRDPKAPRRYDGIETILRDREQVERLAERCKAYRNGTPHPIAVEYGLGGAHANT